MWKGKIGKVKHVWHRHFTVSISCELLRWVLTGSPRNFGNFLLCFERNKCLCWESWAGLWGHSHTQKEGEKIRAWWPQCHLRLWNTSTGTSLQVRKNCVCLGHQRALLTCSNPGLQERLCSWTAWEYPDQPKTSQTGCLKPSSHGIRALLVRSFALWERREFGHMQL